MQYLIDKVAIDTVWQKLQIKLETIEGRLEYVGAVDGHWCIRTPSRERTIQALLRRVAGWSAT